MDAFFSSFSSFFPSFFSSFSSFFGCGGKGISLWGAVAVALLGPMGQLYQRIETYKGTLDKWWLLLPLFYIPPFSFLPAFMMWLGCLQDCRMPNGAPCPGGSVYDWWMLIPMIMKVFSGLIVSNMFPQGGMFVEFILPFIVQLTATAVPIYIRYIEQCKFNGAQPNISQILTSNSFDFKLFSFSLTNSVIQNGVADISVVVINHLPLVNIAFNIIGLIPGLDDIINQIIWSIVYAATYIIMNMTTSQWRSDMMPGSCSVPAFGIWTDQSAAIVLFIISCIIGMMNSAMNSAMNSVMDIGSSSFDDY
jgi:heme exporter protein D